MTSTGAKLKEFVAKKAVLSLNGVTIGAAKNWSITEGYPNWKEPVAGSAIARYGSDTWDAEVEIESLYVSDDNLHALVVTQDIEYTLITTDYDTQYPTPGSIVKTYKVLPTQFKRAGNSSGQGVVRSYFRGVITAVPT